MSEVTTVGELRDAIEGLPDDMRVVAWKGELLRADVHVQGSDLWLEAFGPRWPS